MFLPDVNVLIYAHRTDSCDDHPGYAQWLTDLATSYEPFSLSPLALAGLVRIGKVLGVVLVKQRSLRITFVAALMNLNCFLSATDVRPQLLIFFSLGPADVVDTSAYSNGFIH